MASNSSSSIWTRTFGFEPSTSGLVISLLVAVFAIVLNILEIRVILRKFKKATDFELVLLNLSIADLLSGLDFAVISCFSIHAYRNSPNGIKVNSDLVFAVILFSTSTSTTFVIFIGLERFFAVKLPLKHRMFHTDRRRFLYCLLGTWLFNFVITTLAMVIDKFALRSDQLHVGSDGLGYFVASYLTLGSLFIIILYTWLGHTILVRSVKLLDFDKKDPTLNPKVIKRAMKKEKATIFVCILVLASFLACNLPLVAQLYQASLDSLSAIVMKLNTVLNPLVYFFKGYLEKRYAKISKIPLVKDDSNQATIFGSENLTDGTERQTLGAQDAKVIGQRI
ncbi:mas-related G-protein coupled receptor member A6-like [Rhopilema esculentum]|uniref:mas-related G-protein coupled receptor member A6-like n=1 Tax=Rhopilema esculentum TaxID=499914 RepID=UPI0031D36260|eukprot:gene3651-14892_t